MEKYETVIGLEVHVELNTQSKMFCSCPANYFGAEPNSHTCPVCLGLPGALPFANKEAIEDCIKIGLALNCSINKVSLFERKNYFYPDLAKGYQISQLRWPLCIEGFIEVENDKGEKTKIRINRVHQEEDTGKLTHQNGQTLVDFNRSGVPLVEIVTEPDFTDSSQIRDYAKKLQQIFRYLGVSNADMEKGDMRLEANISVRKKGQKTLPPYRVELKNINSFRFMVAAVEYEIRRQIKAHESGEKLHQETRGWDEEKKETYLQRSKEEANDYRYFPEPDLPQLETAKDYVEKIKAGLPELPHQKIARYKRDFKIAESTAKVLADSKNMALMFETAVAYGLGHGIDAKSIGNQLVNQKIDMFGSSAEQIVDDLIARKASVIEDTSEIEKIAREVIKNDEKSVQAYRSGKTQALMALVGGVMRKTQGKADAVKTKDILKRLLEN